MRTLFLFAAALLLASAAYAQNPPAPTNGPLAPSSHSARTHSGLH